MMIKLTEHIMKTQSIEIEDLPEGWMAVAFRKPKRGEHYIKSYGDMEIGRATVSAEPRLIIEKIQPRRIVLDLTQKEYDLLLSIPIEQRLLRDPEMLDLIEKIKTAQVKETDLSLNSDEPKLSLSVDDARELRNYLPYNIEFYKELTEFIEGNNE